MEILVSDITIGKFRFNGVNKVTINRSIHTYLDKAVITLPSKAQIKRNGKADPFYVITGDQFKDGDPVTIKIGYGLAVTEFEGFVSKRNLNMPLEVECEGYSRQLRLKNNISKNFKTTTVKELLQLATEGTDIQIEVIDEVPLINVKLNNKSGAEICDLIKKETDDTITIYFKEPKLLWAGLVYTPYSQGKEVFDTNTVKYRIGNNVLQSNSLKVRSIDDNPVQIKYANKLPTGEKLLSESQLKEAAAKFKKLCVHIPSKEWLEKLANEKQYRMNYEGYEGKINGFLKPYALPGYSAYIEDARYPKQNGTYLVESTEVTFGTSGARRTAEIGPRLNWSNNQ